MVDAASLDRIPTTHVGSLIRPAALAKLLRKVEHEEPYDAAEFAQCLAKSVTDVMRAQVETGLDIINDGEFGRLLGWTGYVNDRLSGFTFQPQSGGAMEALTGKDMRDFAEFYKERFEEDARIAQMPEKIYKGTWKLTGKIAYTGHAAIRAHIELVKNGLRGLKPADVFMTAVAPASVVTGSHSAHLGQDEQTLFQLAEALREEYKAIVDAGFIVQIDDAFLATTYDVMVPPSTLAEYRKWAELRVAALNHALEGIPENRARYHVCWGSWNGPHTNDVPLKDIVDLILQVRVGGYALEMANPRHEHEWRVWEKVKLPPGRKLIPGVVSHATNVVEHPDLVAERIVRLAQLVGRENVIAGTDCGFAQSSLMRRVHPSIQWAKLSALAQGAARATEQLWGRALA